MFKETGKEFYWHQKAYKSEILGAPKRKKNYDAQIF